ncbi:hypothetical protein MACH24_30530 [Erythrobacter sp. Dej080120_24]|uniref:mannose-1-phosphate guanylyltransferase n=1 Tax=Erythrobacter sp. Dej080120_24 TaxID=3024837 RepID=UPI002922BA1B|nr:hypothetical protein MACH24_30530 [Erythrobacter sp. Dej080120_24]
MHLIHPVILCGGGGTRLWPLSRKAKPKPFLPLVEEESLFQQAVHRLAKDSSFAHPIIVAGSDHVDLIESQLGQVEVAKLVIEPVARNTAPAIALAADLLPQDSIMLVCPSDHHIANPEAFRDAARAAAELARDNYLVAFGIAPDRPETGYGYLERGEALKGGYTIARFVEKPDLSRAQAYLASGDFSWNGGIFAFRAGHYLEELATHRPAMALLVQRAVEKGISEGKRFYPEADAFAAIAGDSVDYAVMENTARAAMVPVEMGWSDIGNWSALADALSHKADGDGNLAKAGTADFDGCSGVLTISDGPRISAVGLEDICIIVSGNEVLVTTRDGAQSVGKLPGAANQ